MPDALTDALDSIRMRGSVFSRAELSAPWGVESARLATGIFHAVVRGRAWARLADGSAPIPLERGDVVLMPFGDHHFMTDAPGRPSRPLPALTTVDRYGMGHLVVDGGGAETSLICGTMEFDGPGAHPLLASLPRLIRVRDPALPDLVETIIGLIAAEVDAHAVGAETVVARLTDVLLVYVLRRYLEELPESAVGWFAALRIPPIRDALGLIHRHPAHPWTAGELARRVGMSRSAFFARFKSAVGETPREYLTLWRMHLATRLLREERLSVAAAAHRVGYLTEASFSNAFTKVMGIRPGAYKRAAPPAASTG